MKLRNLALSVTMACAALSGALVSTTAMAQAKEQFCEVVSLAGRGLPTTITRHNKPVAKLVPISEVSPELVARRRQIFQELQAIGREIERRGGPLTVEEILEWRDEGRR